MYKTPVAVARHRISNRLSVFWSSTCAETVTEATFRHRLLPFAHPVKRISSMSSSTVRSGSCLCKSIKYEIIGDPITFRVCHCMNCRKATGSAFMSNLVFSKEVGYLHNNHVQIILNQLLKLESPSFRRRGTP